MLSDTGEEAERLQFERIQAMSPAEKFQLVSDLSAAVDELALAGLRHDHPDATPKQLHRLLLIRKYGADLVDRLCVPVE